MIKPGVFPMSQSEYIKQYLQVRSFSERLCAPLETEDYLIQSMPDVSPTRWHLAHTTWFFETFILKPELHTYRSPNERYNYLFNSYYNAIGDQYPRPKRGLLSRPTVQEVYAYRQHVDQQMQILLDEMSDIKFDKLKSFLVLGLNHEQQHQELMLTDIKHVFFQNPLFPVYQKQTLDESSSTTPPYSWTQFGGGQVKHGYSGDGFCFDNETPRHDILLQPFELGNRLITNGEYLSFIEAGGYKQPKLWLSDGWAIINSGKWDSPLYWVKQDDKWSEFTLSGLLPLQPESPVTHLSYYEADAFANWSGVRLPSEFEWEFAARGLKSEGNFVEGQQFHPRPVDDTQDPDIQQMFGDVWEWTRSPYSPYPGFKVDEGAVGEYNGKFMSSQMVLKGGSCATSSNHIRSTYRNFFYPHSRWQFMGLRLARDVGNGG